MFYVFIFFFMHLTHCVIISVKKVTGLAWAQGGLNPWPTGYEPVALPG
jgi:hypothetical protein